MTKPYVLIRGGLLVDHGHIRRRDLLLKGDLVEDPDFKGSLPPGCQVLEAKGDYVSPGLIELHAHGGGGGDLLDCSLASWRKVSQMHLTHGVTTMLPTASTAPFSEYRKLFRQYRRYAAQLPNFYGIHLEGIYLSPGQKGAHHENLLHPPMPEETQAILTEGRGLVKRITAAPELPGMFAFSEQMAGSGIVMSIGHSDAVSEVVREAAHHGFTHITHFYNGTSTWRKIDQKLYGGVVEGGYLCDELTLELIADGRHVAADCGRLAYRIKGPDKMCFVTDALRPAGQHVKVSYLGERIPQNRVIIEDGVAKLPDRSVFAGSIACGFEMLQTGVTYFGFPLAQVVTMLTQTPAAILGDRHIGTLDKGCAADAIIFSRDLKLKKVIKNGVPVV